MDIKSNFTLYNYNTFKIDSSARYFASFKNEDELLELIDFLDVKKK